MTETFMRRVSELVDARVLQVEDGNHGEYRPRPEEFTKAGMSYIRAADISSGVVNFASAEKITRSAVSRIRKGIGADLDVLLSHKGTVGKIALVPQGSPPYVCSPQTTSWRSLDHARLDPRYLHVALRAPDFVRQLDVMKSSTDMAPYVSLTQQRTMSIPVPPIATQRAIADVLGALDDKIAANKNLAATADALVRSSWDLVAQQSSDSVRLESVVSSVRSTAHPGEVEPGSLYVGLEHVPRRMMWLESGGTADSVTSNKSRFERGDVLFGKLRPYFHKVAAAPSDGICSTDIIVLRPIDQSLSGYALAAVASDLVVNRSTAASEGTRMPRTSWKQLVSIEVPWPGLQAAAQLSEQVSALGADVQRRLDEIRTLAELRDALLPALMSGKLRVRDAERAVEAIA